MSEFIKGNNYCIVTTDKDVIKELDRIEFPELVIQKKYVKNIEYNVVNMSKNPINKITFSTIEELKSGDGSYILL